MWCSAAQAFSNGLSVHCYKIDLNHKSPCKVSLPMPEKIYLCFTSASVGETKMAEKHKKHGYAPIYLSGTFGQ